MADTSVRRGLAVRPTVFPCVDAARVTLSAPPSRCAAPARPSDTCHSFICLCARLRECCVFSFLTRLEFRECYTRHFFFVMEEFENFEVTQEDLEQIDNIEINLLNSSFHISSEDEDDNILPLPSNKRRRRIIRSESEDSELENTTPDMPEHTQTDGGGWGPPEGKQRHLIAFTDISGPSYAVRSTMVNKSPVDFYSLFVPDNMLLFFVSATNKYAIEQISKKPNASAGARIKQWVPTNYAEMKKFLSLLLFMGVVKLPKISDYWSKDKVIGHPFAKTIMSRNRFEIMLRMLHFSEDDEKNKSDRLHRVRKLMNDLNESFRKHFTANENICIDESMVPFRGRIIFRQYNKQKRHKYGVKLFKLCSTPGYTHKVNIYAGKNIDTINTTPTNVVMNMCEDYFNRGHTLHTDNWYTSVDLARKLLDKQTHLVGTLRKNRRGLPKKVTSTKLKKGQYYAEESRDGITVLKWKDKRDVLVLSTKHSVRFLEITKRGKVVKKPHIILDYNKAKGGVDLADQLASYSTPLRKSIRWYKKIALDMLLNISLINAYVLYQSVCKTKIKVTDFRIAVLKSFYANLQVDEPDPSRPKRKKHVLVKLDGPSRKTRRNCGECYKTNVKNLGRLQARNKTKKVNTFCSVCPEKPILCHDCFFKIHF